MVYPSKKESLFDKFGRKEINSGVHDFGLFTALHCPSFVVLFVTMKENEDKKTNTIINFERNYTYPPYNSSMTALCDP